MLLTASMGMGGRRDNRSAIIRAAVAESRLSSYVSPARYVLDSTGTDVTLWFDQGPESGFICPSELRWLKYNAAADTLEVHYIELPDALTPVERELLDAPYVSSTDWQTVHSDFTAQGIVLVRTLLDGVTALAVTATGTDVTYTLTLATSVGEVDVDVEASVREPAPPP
jgi:hypothetical protein